MELARERVSNTTRGTSGEFSYGLCWLQDTYPVMSTDLRVSVTPGISMNEVSGFETEVH